MRKGEPVTAVPVRPARPLWWTAVAVLAMTLAAGNVTAATLGTSAGVTILSSSPVITSDPDEPLRFGALTCDEDEEDDEEVEDCDDDELGESGTVTVNTDGQRSAMGGVRLLGGGNFGPAEFTISGTPDTPYSVDLPESILVQRDGSAPTPGVTLLVAINLTSSSTTLGGASETGIGQIGADGFDILFIGGTLLVTETTRAGNYQVDVIPFTVAYQ